jgi:hypothetical protein
MQWSLLTRLFCTSFGCWLIAATSSVLAQTNGFVPPSGVGNYADASNWALGHVPTTGEQVSIREGREATINTAIAETPTLFHLAGGNASGKEIEGILNIEQGADLHVLSQMRLGIGDDVSAMNGIRKYAIVNQSGGSITVDDALFIGFDAWATIDYNFSGGAINTNNLWFRQGTGRLNQTGGSITADNLILGEGGFTTVPPNGESFYDLKGGTLEIQNRAFIGMAGGDELEDSFGTMRISGSGVATFGDLYFGTDETDYIEIVGNGVLNINQNFYSVDYAQEDMANGRILGNDLEIRTVEINSVNYTQIVSTATIATPGDFNGDGSVDAADYTVWRDHLGDTDEAAIANNGDGENGVDGEDYNLWKSSFGQSYSGSASLAQSSVPEPGSAVLLIAGLLILSAPRCRVRTAA